MIGTPRNWLFHIILAIFFSVMALIVRFSLLDMHRPLGGDEVEYHALAVRLWEGRGFSDERGNPTAYRTPGLPVLLGFLYRLTGPDPRAARVALAAVGGLSSGLLVLLTSRVLNVYTGAVAGMIWNFMPFNLALNGSLLGETPAAFVLLAALVVCCFFHFPWACFIGGFLVGYSILIRPYLFFVVIPFGAWLWACGGRKTSRLLLFLMGWILVVGGWTVRNYVVLNTLTFTTQGAVEVFSGNHRLARGSWLRPEVYLQYLKPRYPNWDTMNEVERANVYAREAWREIGTAPTRLIWLLPRKAVIFLSPFSAYMGRDWVYLGMLPFWLIGVASLASDSRRRPLLWLFVGPVLAVMVVVLATFGDPRFRHPVEPLMVAVAAEGIRIVSSRIRRGFWGTVQRWKQACVGSSGP
jgi:hypothetical protein